MIYILEFITILAYMINGKVGMLCMLIMSLLVLLGKERQFVKIFKLLILSMPMAYIGIAGIQMSQFLSWFNIFIIVCLLVVLLQKTAIKKDSACVILLSIITLVPSAVLSNNILESAIEIMQIMLMIAPIAIFYGSETSRFCGYRESQQLVGTYANVCIVSAIAMIIQYCVYHFAGITIGIIEHSNARVSFFCLFKGPGVPIMLGIGFVILLNDILELRKSRMRIVGLVVLFTAIVLNSSRSGVYAIVLISAYCVIASSAKEFLKGSLSLKHLVLTICIICGGCLGVSYIINLRSISIFDDNGRFFLIENAMRIWTYSVKNFFFGEGFSGGLWEDYMSPHNMIAQTLSECGLLFSVIAFSAICRFTVRNKDSMYIGCVFYTLVYGMLVTEFYANTFTTVFYIILILHTYSSEKEDALIERRHI